MSTTTEGLKEVDLKQQQLYVVVCSELHGAIGPFTDLKDAVEFSKNATNHDIKVKTDPCTYYPVPFRFTGTMLTDADEDRLPGVKEDGAPSPEPGQYL